MFRLMWIADFMIDGELEDVTLPWDPDRLCVGFLELAVAVAEALADGSYLAREIVEVEYFPGGGDGTRGDSGDPHDWG